MSQATQAPPRSRGRLKQISWAGASGSGDEKIAPRTVNCRVLSSSYGVDDDEQLSKRESLRARSAQFLAAQIARERCRDARAAGKQFNFAKALFDEFLKQPGGAAIAGDEQTAITLAQGFVAAARQEGVGLDWATAMRMAKGELEAQVRDEKQLTQFARQRYSKCSDKTRRADASALAIKEVAKRRAAGTHQPGDYDKILSALLS